MKLYKYIYKLNNIKLFFLIYFLELFYFKLNF